MSNSTKAWLGGLVIATSLLPCVPASAAVIFSDNFNSYQGVAPSTQYGTMLPVEAAGTLSNWIGSGTNAIHAVERSQGDWAPMLYQTNQITTINSYSANTLGVNYNVSFAAAAAVYDNPNQATNSSDYIEFAVTDSSNKVLYTYDYYPGAFMGPNSFVNDGFSYTGNGVGGVKFSVADVLIDGRFGGALDNFSVSSTAQVGSSTSVPEPSSFALVAGALALVGAASKAKRSSYNKKLGSE